MCCSIQSPIQGRATWPATKGSSSCSDDRLDRAGSDEPAPCACSSQAATSTGVRKMPIRFEAEAAQTAAATLPRATEVKAIEDCTVEGRQQQEQHAGASVGGRIAVGSCGAARPSSGNSGEGRGQDHQVQAPVGQARASPPRATAWRRAGRTAGAMTSLVNRPKSSATTPRTGAQARQHDHGRGSATM